MAELMQNPGKSAGNKPVKKSTRVDLTPMVDLGFLLITFFIFTTTMSTPTAMKMALPDDTKVVDKPTVVSREKTLQLVLENDNKISYFFGDDSTHTFYTDYSTGGVRKVIQDKLKQVTEIYQDPAELVVLIRPKDVSSYKNVVDVMDEMLINDIKRYMLLTSQN